MVGRGELTDKAWEQIAPLLPENGRRGGRWRDHRLVINGTLWKLRTGSPCTLARPARALRTLADLLRPLRALAARWNLGSAFSQRANEVRRRGRGGFDFPNCRRLLRKRGTSRTPSRSGCTDASGAQFLWDDRRASMLQSTQGATWSSGASIGSSNGEGSPLATRSERSTTGPQWSSLLW
jgi:transposase